MTTANFSTKSWPNGYKDIDPFESYRSVFNGELSTVENPELIFTRGNNQGSYGVNYMVFYQLPVSKAKGNNTTCVTQKQCDAYYMKDGKDIPGKDIEIGRGDGSSQRVTGFVTASDVSKGLYKTSRRKCIASICQSRTPILCIGSIQRSNLVVDKCNTEQ